MRISKQWLQTFVDFVRSFEDIADDLTTAGLEVDALETCAAPSHEVVVARIESVRAHDSNDRLSLCRVDVGTEQPIEVVCGAPNARPGLRAPCALPGAALPGGVRIETTTIAGVASAGMLCSAAELALGGEGDRLWALPDDAPLGTVLAEYLGLPDQVITLDLTPNRGDCLSMLGVARETAIIVGRDLPDITIDDVSPEHEHSIAVTIDSDQSCPAYVARVVNGLSGDAITPAWITERLRRSGIRAINMPVDVGNYVMLATGQPMHAFDADKLDGNISVRQAITGETITTLDDVDVALEPSTLVIADDTGPVAIAGMIGGLRTAVDRSTTRIVFEAAHFTPGAVAGQGRRYKITTDSLHRFERGVDSAMPRTAIEYATQLLCENGRGQPGPVVAAGNDGVNETPASIELNGAAVERILGQAIEPGFIDTALRRLGMRVTQRGEDQWQVESPTWRFDLEREVDLIEEIARLYGYQNLVAEPTGIELPAYQASSQADQDHSALLRARGYHEAITYSFVDDPLQTALSDDTPAITLDNPISEYMAVMRKTLLPGLLEAWRYNSRRGHDTIRLFENGLRFERSESVEHGIAQISCIAGIAAGLSTPGHWSTPDKPVDFFDIKGDVDALFAMSDYQPRFQAGQLPGLHPGRSAVIVCNGQRAGVIGQLSSNLGNDIKNKDLPYVFQVDNKFLSRDVVTRYTRDSDQPDITRDLAVVVADQVVADQLVAAVWSIESVFLQSVDVVDVFTGQGLDSGFKSVALRLIFQDKTSTLTREQVDESMNRVGGALDADCGARIRGQ